MFRIAFKDYWGFIKKNKLLFCLISLGLFVVSFISLFITDVLRYNFIFNTDFGCSAVAYLYHEPISSKDLYGKLKDIGISSVGIMFVSEQSHNNEPANAKEALKDGRIIITNSDVDYDKLGIVGYKRPTYSSSLIKVYSGRYLSSFDIGKKNCFVHDSVVPFFENGIIEAYGHDFEVIGTSMVSLGLVPYDHSSAIVTPETFAMLDIPLKMVIINFGIPPIESYANEIVSVLDSFGENSKSSEPLDYFNIEMVLGFVKSCALYLFAVCIVVSMLILIFKCWISSQQSVFRIYSICGISGNKLSLIRKIQVVLFYVPTFLLASVSYIVMVFMEYKSPLLNPVPIVFIVNFIVNIILLFVMTDLQNRKNSGFEALRAA